MDRAYSLLTIKEFDEEKRTFSGVATTPTPDRMGDVVEPKGAEYKLPIPFLWQHDHRKPIGHITSVKVSGSGIEVKGYVEKIAEDGDLKKRLDEAWQSIKIGLVKGLSIGFKPLESARIGETYTYRFIKWLWLELSAVTIPANGDCSITAIKSMDRNALAASGRKDIGSVRLITPGASGQRNPKTAEEATSVTIAEQIAALEASRAAKAAQMTAIMAKSGAEGRTSDDAEAEEFDTVAKEIEGIDAQIKRLRTLEKLQVTQAAPVAGRTPAEGSAARGAQSIVVRQPKLEKGIAFTRYVSAIVQAKGNRFEAAQIAERWKESTPEISEILRAPIDMIEKTAVNPGSTTDSTWAGPLVQYTNMASEFIDYLRPLTILGRIQGLRQVPFKIKVPRQTGGASVNWVGEGKVKPLSSLAFDSITLDHFKVAGIIPLNEELVRLSSPSAETLVRNDLAEAIAQLIDRDFVDPTKALQDGVSPASITNGVTPITASGITADALRTDVKSLFGTFLTNNLQVSSGVWIMTQTQALSIGLMTNALGQPEFPGIGIMGGTFMGFPVIVSENVPSTGGSPTDGSAIIFAMPGEIMFADDGGVTIDVSREASLQMETTPDSPATASTTLVSLWQHNMIAIKAERYINWKKRRDYAVAYIQYAKYAD